MADGGKFTDVSLKAVYSDLPEHVQHHLGELDLQPLNSSSTSYVKSFVGRVVRKNKKDLGSKLRHDPVMLDRLSKRKPNKKPKRKEMSAREKRSRGIYKISPKNQRYDMYLPLHELWQGYMQEMLNLTPDCYDSKEDKL